MVTVVTGRLCGGERRAQVGIPVKAAVHSVARDCSRRAIHAGKKITSRDITAVIARSPPLSLKTVREREVSRERIYVAGNLKTDLGAA